MQLFTKIVGAQKKVKENLERTSFFAKQFLLFHSSCNFFVSGKEDGDDIERRGGPGPRPGPGPGQS